MIRKPRSGSGDREDRSSPMARTETTSLWAELPSFSLYKRNQGKWVRLWTAIAIFATFALAAMSLSQSVLLVAGPALQYGIPAIIIAIGGWLAFRLVIMVRPRQLRKVARLPGRS